MSRVSVLFMHDIQHSLEHLNRFLESDSDFILISSNLELIQQISKIQDERLPEVDYIQFHKLKSLKKGELGIREIRWQFADFITSSKLYKSLRYVRLHNSSRALSTVLLRLVGMCKRRIALEALLNDFGTFGYVVPHYVEPVPSSVLISRRFASVLIQIIGGTNLSLFRAAFALSRTANFKCVRIRTFE